MKYAAGLVCLAFFVSVLSSCNPHACEGVSCIHGTAVRFNGGCNCTCDTDYQGHNCDTLIDRIRYHYLAPNGAPTTWISVDTCNNITNYKLVLYGDPTSNAIYMLNFDNIGNTDSVYAYVDSAIFEFPGSQNFNDTVITNLYGTIFPNGDTILVTYSYGSNNVPSNTCYGKWVKQ